MAYRAFRRRVLYPKRAPTPAPRQLGGVGADGLGVIAEGFVELRALADHALDHVGELGTAKRVEVELAGLLHGVGKVGDSRMRRLAADDACFLYREV